MNFLTDTVFNQTVTYSFWQEQGATQNHRIRQRVLMGAAVEFDDRRFGVNNSYLPSSGAAGANWLPRDGQHVVMQEDGGPAIVGITRASDGDATPSLAPIAVAGFAIGDSTVGHCPRAGYFETQYTTGNYGYGLEIVLKNKGNNVVVTPNGAPFGATFGAQFVGGGDPSYGGAATNPNSAGIIFTKLSQTWNRALVILRDALTIDALTGLGVAIEMGVNHAIQWCNANGVSARINGRGTGSKVDIEVNPGGGGSLVTPKLNLSALPTSPSGLNAGDVWNSSGTLKIV